MTPAEDEASVLNEEGILATEVLCVIWDSEVLQKWYFSMEDDSM
jgi:hypothetical protein